MEENNSSNMQVVPEKYGITETKAVEIAKAFTPVKIEINAIYKIYEALLNSDITPEICEQAGKLSTVLSKANATLGRTHKAEKDCHWQACKYLDALKNKDQVTIDTMQGRLKELKGYYETLEKERIEKLEASRAKELVKYEKESPGNLGTMDDEFWKDYLAVIKLNYEKNIEAEKKAEEERINKERLDKLELDRESIAMPYKKLWKHPKYDFRNMKQERFYVLINDLKEAEKTEILHNERKESILHLWQFVSEDLTHVNYGEFNSEDWDEFVEYLNKKKKSHDKEQEEIKKENKRLKGLEKAKIQKQKKEREERERKAIIFLKDNGFENDSHGMRSKTHHHIIGSAHYSELDTDKEYEMFVEDVVNTKEKEERKAKEDKEIKALKDKLEAEKVARETAQNALQKAKQKKLIEAMVAKKAEQDALKAPDKVKLESLCNALGDIQMPELKTNKGKIIISHIQTLIDKTRTYINEQSDKL